MLRKSSPITLRCGNQLIDLTTPVVMGVINVTPDSFYTQSRVDGTIEKAIEWAAAMIEEGARIIDVGGMSSRPGAKEIPVDEERRRVLPMVEALHSSFPEAVISVDTYRARVAEDCIRAGATMINDISGGQLDRALWKVVADANVAYVVMHMRGTPDNMQYNIDYQDFIADLIKYFVNRIRLLRQVGINDIVLDPGFGFSKNMEQNYQLISQLDILGFLDFPIMIGISRKSTLSKTIGRPTEETLEATTALHMVALEKGASILRVHDVRAAMDTIAVHRQIQLVNTLNNKRLSRI